MLMGDCQSIHQPSVCPQRVSVAILTVYLLTGCHRFISQLRVCLSIPQSIHSCFSQHPSSFRPPATRLSPPTVHLSVCLSVCLSSLVFPPTVNRRFGRRLCVYSPAVCHHFWRRLSAGAGCGWRRTRGPTVKNDRVLQRSRGYYVLCTNRPSPANRVLA